MNLVIFDDDSLFRDRISRVIETLNGKHLLCGKIHIAISAGRADQVLHYIHSNPPPTVFLFDIVDEQGVSVGYKLGQAVRADSPYHQIIYITQYPKRIIYNGYEKTNSLNIIVKNCTDAQLMDDLLNSLFVAGASINRRLLFSVKTLYDGHILVPFDDILFMQKVKAKKNILLYREHNGINRFAGNLYEQLARLDSRFIQCSRSGIVNTDKIIYVDTSHKKLYFTPSLTCRYDYGYIPAAEIVKFKRMNV